MNRMLGTYLLVLADKKTPKRAEAIIKSLKAHELNYTQLMETRELNFSEWNNGRTRRWTEKHECLVIYADGNPVFKAPKKAKPNPLYEPFKGPSDVEYVPSAEDLAFFAETEALPNTMITEAAA